MNKPKIVVVAGPTATGKSAIAVEIASIFNGEVVTADSMQVYRHMDIGTAKPASEEMGGVPHHLMDIVDPDEEYTAARFSREAGEAIENIASRSRLPIVAGGTGLYIRALLHGLFEGPVSDKAIREGLMAQALDKGKEALHEELKKIDPEAASSIHPNNIARVIRAIEVYRLTGKPISAFQKEHGFTPSRFDALKIGLIKEREELYRDIDARVDRMMEAGLVEEVKTLLERGYSARLKPMGGLGYKEVAGYLSGRYPIDEAVRLLKMNTRHYAKRQLTWFRKDPGIKWFHPARKQDIIDTVRGFLN